MNIHRITFLATGFRISICSYYVSPMTSATLWLGRQPTRLDHLNPFLCHILRKTKSQK